MTFPRAVATDQLGPPSNYRLVPHDPGQPGEGQVRLAIKATGISYVDVLTASGQYQVKPPVPFIPGSESAGIIEAVGPGVTAVKPGDRVAVSGWGGLFAEAAVVPARSVRVIPDAMALVDAALFTVSYATGWHALVQRAAIQPGESLLVLGAAGATGYAAIQTAKHLGARVIASASSEEKRALALAGGADAVVDARSETWRDDVKAANGGKPVDVVFDPVGGEATDPAFRSLAWKGRHLIIGFPGGIAALRTNLPLLKGASLVGVDLRQFAQYEPDVSEANQREIFRLAGEGVLKPAIAKRYRIEDYEAAMTEAASGTSAGRIVLVMD